MATKPIVNINGTSVGDLKKQALEALSGLQTAADAVSGMAPNGRDYPNDRERLRLAEFEHRDRLLRLDRVRTEVEEIALHLDAEERIRNRLAVPARMEEEG